MDKIKTNEITHKLLDVPCIIEIIKMAKIKNPVNSVNPKNRVQTTYVWTRLKRLQDGQDKNERNNT